MKISDPRRILQRALIPAACAALLSACAPYEPLHPVYGSTAPAVDPALSAFDRLDGNRDGFLSRSEVESLGVYSRAVSVESTNAAFHRLDANGDGFLSRAEAQSTLASIPGASFDASDTDRDGFLSLAEATSHLRWLEMRQAPGAVAFETYDTNRDGFLTRAEADSLLRLAPAGRVVTAPAWSFDRLDANRDGFLSRAEAAAVANPGQFDRYDGNRDGFLSRAEVDIMFGTNVGGTAGTPAGSVYGPR